MKTRLVSRLAVLTLVVLVLVSIISAAAAANTVPPSSLADQSRSITAYIDLVPPECQTLTLSAVTYCPTGGGTCTGHNGNSGDLILGTGANDNINAGNGNDCLVGGAGQDTLDGGPGKDDVCIGHVGDTYSRCETIVNK